MPRARVEAGRQALGEPEREVHRADLAPLRRERAGRAARSRQGSSAPVLANSSRLGAAACRRRCRGTASALLVDDPHHLLGRDAVGGQRRDERAGARADVDVELVDRAVDRQQVERAQRADLVDAAGEAAAAEDERGLRAPRAAAPRARGAALRRWRVPAPGPRLTTLPMRLQSTERRGRRVRAFPQTDAPIGRRPARSPMSLGYRASPCASPDASAAAPLGALALLPCARAGGARRSTPARCARRSTRVGGTRRGALGASRRPDDREHALRAQRRRAADPRLGREALHDRDRAAPLRARRRGSRRRVVGDGERRREGPARRRPLPRRRRRPDARRAPAIAPARAAGPRRRRAARRAARSSATSRCFDALRGGPRTGCAYDSDMGGVLGALTVGRGCVGAARRPGARRRRAARALAARPPACAWPGRTGTGTAPTDGAAARRGASPPIAHAGRADQPPVGQLLRRDAAQGPRRRVRLAAARRRPGAARRARGRWRRSGIDGARRRRLRALARQPHERRSRSSRLLAAMRRTAQARRVRGVARRSPGAPGRCASACAAPPPPAPAAARPGRSTASARSPGSARRARATRSPSRSS